MSVYRQAQVEEFISREAPSDKLSDLILPLIGKEPTLLAELDSLYQDLDLDRLRVQRPSRFIFFCGGATSENAKDASSLRHYLLNERKIGPRLKAHVVLAETATQLYRDTAYQDLITFEEDIAKIAAMVLVIAESPGSLAELGAFASIETIRRSVTILMQEKYADAETFIRFGPVERIKNEGDGRVAFFPWKTHNNGKVNKSSASPHVRNIIEFINERLSKVPTTTLLSNNPDLKSFVILYWILYLSLAMPLGKLTSYATNMIDNLDDRGVRRKLYCMQLAGWINITHYSNVDYYYCCRDVDPIHYIFRRDVAERESIRRKAVVVAAIQRDLLLPKHIREVVFENRKPQPR